MVLEAANSRKQKLHVEIEDTGMWCYVRKKKFKFHQTSIIFSCFMAHASFTVFIKGWVALYPNLKKIPKVKSKIVWPGVFLSLVVWVLLFPLRTEYSFLNAKFWELDLKVLFFTTYRDPRSFRSPSSFLQVMWNRILGTISQHRVVFILFYSLQQRLRRIHTVPKIFLPVLTN